MIGFLHSKSAFGDAVTVGVLPTIGGTSFGLSYDLSEGKGNRYGAFYRSIPENEEKNQIGESYIGGYYKGVVTFGKISFSGSIGIAYQNYEASQEAVTGFASSLGYGIFRIVKPRIKVGIENMIFNTLSGDLEGRQKNMVSIALEYWM